MKESARTLGNSGSVCEEIGKDIQGGENCDAKSESHSVVEFKTEFPVIDITELDSANEGTQRKPDNSKNEPDSDPMNNAANDKLGLKEHCTKEFWLTMAPRKGIFPKITEETHEAHNLPQFRCCSVEHNYCQIKKFGWVPRKIKIRKSTWLKEQSRNTFKFENEPELGKKRMEQQTIDIRDSITTNHVDSDSNSSESRSIKGVLKKPVSPNNNSNINGVTDVTDTQVKKKAVRFLTPKIRIRRTWKGSGDYYDVIIQEGASMPPPFLAAKPDSSEIKNSTLRELEGQNSDTKPDSRKRKIDSDDIDEVTEIEEIMERRSEAFLNSGDKHAQNVGLKNEIVAAKIRKNSSKDDSELKNEGGFVLSKPNLAKTVQNLENWNVRYTEDDVKNLGLDDLLLRASELNAENFTKALGQNSGGRNGNKVDSSEIVLSFPASKRESDEPLDGDDSKGGSIKKAKLEILKKCVLDDNFMKSIEEESLKKITEGPKKPGIKVKTVQNINEEFKDSLGAKLKKLEGRDVAPEGSIPVFTIHDDTQECNQAKEVFALDKIPEKQAAALLSCRKVNKQLDPTKNIDEIREETRPYTMTLIPNKDKTAKDHMPTGLTPKVFVKPKPVFANHGTFLPTIEGTPGNAANNKIPEVRDPCSKPNDNVTFAVPEPRSFEVVNVDGYTDPNNKKTTINSHFVLNCGTYTKKDSDGKNLMHGTLDGGVKKRNIPILLSRNRKYLRMPLVNNQKLLISPADDKQINGDPCPQNKVANPPPEVTANIRRENNCKETQSCTISAIEPRVIMKDPKAPVGGGKFIQLIPNIISPKSAPVKENNSQTEGKTNPEVQNDNVSRPRPQMMSLAAFANILKDILPDKWILSLDKKFGLQILKTHLDDYLNPSIMISVVVGRTGKVTVNVRGRQLETTHELFANLCDIGNSKEKLSINYILAIMNRLRFYGICFGCDDLSLKKYWCEDGFIEYYTEFQQTYRSHICESLIRLGRKRCHPCYRMHESLKKRRRREIIARKAGKLPKPKPVENVVTLKYSMTHNSQEKGGKRNLEDIVEESFIQMRQRIADEIEIIKEEEEDENVPKTQDEVLGFMGLTRKESLDVTVRKSKRERKLFKKGESLVPPGVNKEELYFLEKYWHEINVLFSTSLLVGAYSRLSMGKLKEKCKTFYRLLATWREIIRENAISVGGFFNLAENLVNNEGTVNSESLKKKFDKMDIDSLRAYVICCVKEVNRMKSRLRTKNNYFRVLYNTYLKPRMKKVKQAAESVGSSDANMDLEKEVAPKKKTPEKSKKMKLSTSTEMGSSD